MHKENTPFRSKREREAEVKLEKNYREIGISALAAASKAFAKKDATLVRPVAMVPAE